jgi:hypothetical protein
MPGFVPADGDVPFATCRVLSLPTMQFEVHSVICAPAKQFFSLSLRQLS